MSRRRKTPAPKPAKKGLVIRLTLTSRRTKKKVFIQETLASKDVGSKPIQQPKLLNEATQKPKRGSKAFVDAAVESITNRRAEEGKKRLELNANESERVKKGVTKGKALARKVARSVADWMMEQYQSFIPSTVKGKESLLVEALELGNGFGLRIQCTAEVQKWVYILENGTSSEVNLMDTARVSPKRKAVQIYRPMKAGQKKRYLRSKKEGGAGYYITLPLLYGRAQRVIKGKADRIEVTEIFSRKKYEDGVQKDVVPLSLTGEKSDRTLRQQSSVLKRWAQKLSHKDRSSTNELESDPDGVYQKHAFYEAGEYAEDTPRWVRGKDGITLRKSSRGSGRVITRDPENNRLIISERGSFEANPNERGETAETLAYEKRLGGKVRFREGKDGKGDLVRFRRVSTRGKAPLKNVPANPNLARHIMRDARIMYTNAIMQLISETSAQYRKESKRRGLGLEGEAVISTLSMARTLL